MVRRIIEKKEKVSVKKGRGKVVGLTRSKQRSSTLLTAAEEAVPNSPSSRKKNRNAEKGMVRGTVIKIDPETEAVGRAYALEEDPPS